MTALATQIEEEGVGLVETRFAIWLEPLLLDSGATLAPVTIAYETYGKLSPARDNAILLLHALSGDAHAAGKHTPFDYKPGWWDMMVGPGRPFDTDRYFVICSNVIGGCQGSTGPNSFDPATGRPYGARFPVVTVGDMVRAQTRLIDLLGIEQLLAVAGGSLGGYQALEWVVTYPERVRGAILMATSARSSTQSVAWNAIGRRAVMSDPRWRSGDYYGHEPPIDGLAVARMIGHITYRSDLALEQKFGRSSQNQRPGFSLAQEFEIERYLEHQASSFNARFDANSYLYITKAMDYWDLPARYGSIGAALARTQASFLVLSFASDWLFPPADSFAIVQALRRLKRPVEYVDLPSTAGHDAFLIEHRTQAPLVESFLERVYAQPALEIGSQGSRESQ